MMPDPLHPAIVHLPIALAMLLPGLAILAIVTIQKDLFPARLWGLIVLLQAILVGSTWLAMETGEEQEDRVERVVAERHIETHEEAAERFVLLTGLALLAVGAGLLPDKRGAVGRIVGTVATLVVFAAATSVGHSGGELVYKYGAASAYVDGQGASDQAAGHDEHDDDD
ncbi:MAG: hypothetical protein QF570_03450 [Myxococcota bacterium]|jgi:uncharacterized membrane protein|nr:hypothetical protein [Myxococcota bacterium]